MIFASKKISREKTLGIVLFIFLYVSILTLLYNTKITIASMCLISTVILRLKQIH